MNMKNKGSRDNACLKKAFLATIPAMVLIAVSLIILRKKEGITND